MSIYITGPLMKLFEKIIVFRSEVFDYKMQESVPYCFFHNNDFVLMYFI